jgi:hypothetical protein
LGVIGLDIELTSLSAFLGSLQIGRSGRAMIIDETGRLVAYPEVARMMKEKGGELVALRLNELGDPVLDRAFNRFLIEKDGRRELSVQGITYINTFSSLQSAVDKRWSILIVVPSQDFVGFVSSNNRKALLMSIGVVILASLLAGLLIWQGLQADRSARLLLERRQEMETQSRAFSDLAARPAIFDPADIEALEHVTRITAEAIGVRRVSVWQWQLRRQRFFLRPGLADGTGGHARRDARPNRPGFFVGQLVGRLQSYRKHFDATTPPHPQADPGAQAGSRAAGRAVQPPGAATRPTGKIQPGGSPAFGLCSRLSGHTLSLAVGGSDFWCVPAHYDGPGQRHPPGAQ